MADTDAALVEIDRFIAEQDIDTKARDWRTHLPEPPLVSFTPGKRYLWQLETNHGSLEVQLMPDVAPRHVSSTIYLTRLGFYDGLAFHRVIEEFMAQGGCPRGTGTGGPGYEYAGEFDKRVKHDRPGLLSMANAGPGTDGSQFFLTFVPTPWLDGKHTIFGEVVTGKDTTLKALERQGSRTGKTKSDVQLIKATVQVS